MKDFEGSGQDHFLEAPGLDVRQCGFHLAVKDQVTPIGHHPVLGPRLRGIRKRIARAGGWAIRQPLEFPDAFELSQQVIEESLGVSSRFDGQAKSRPGLLAAATQQEFGQHHAASGKTFPIALPRCPGVECEAAHEERRGLPHPVERIEMLGDGGRNRNRPGASARTFDFEHGPAPRDRESPGALSPEKPILGAEFGVRGEGIAILHGEAKGKDPGQTGLPRARGAILQRFGQDARRKIDGFAHRHSTSRRLERVAASARSRFCLRSASLPASRSRARLTRVR